MKTFDIEIDSQDDAIRSKNRVIEQPKLLKTTIRRSKPWQNLADVGGSEPVGSVLGPDVVIDYDSKGTNVQKWSEWQQKEHAQRGRRCD